MLITCLSSCDQFPDQSLMEDCAVFFSAGVEELDENGEGSSQQSNIMLLRKRTPRV